MQRRGRRERLLLREVFCVLRALCVLRAKAGSVGDLTVLAT